MILLITLMNEYQIMEDNGGNLYVQTPDQPRRPLTLFELALVKHFLEWANGKPPALANEKISYE